MTFRAPPCISELSGKFINVALEMDGKISWIDDVEKRSVRKSQGGGKYSTNDKRKEGSELAWQLPLKKK